MRSFLILAACALPVHLAAHHSMSAMYDQGRTIAINGTVTRYEWANPHVWVFVDTRDATYEVEFASRMEMKRAGWDRATFKVGDSVAIQATPARDGSKRALGKKVSVSGVERAIQAPRPATQNEKRPAPKWPDGRPRLGPEPGQQGYWEPQTASGFFDNRSGAVAMNAEGLLANVRDAEKVAPFQPWARGLYLYRQRNFFNDDPLEVCLPPGGPRQFQAPYGLRFLEDRDRQRIFVMSRGGNRNWRLIYLDGREVPNAEDVTPSYFGYSSARWEGDTLVVESSGYIERFWFANGGLPHTESLRLTERISRPDYSTLRYEVTVNDPGAYTRPWSGALTLDWVAGEDEDEYFCDDYNRELEHVK